MSCYMCMIVRSQNELSFHPAGCRGPAQQIQDRRVVFLPFNAHGDKRPGRENVQKILMGMDRILRRTEWNWSGLEHPWICEDLFPCMYTYMSCP